MGAVMLLVSRLAVVGMVRLAHRHHQYGTVLTPFTSTEALGPGITQPRDAGEERKEKIMCQCYITDITYRSIILTLI